ncbi:MAG: glycoside hydrolase/phage tail family protein [Jannaschia sp.]
MSAAVIGRAAGATIGRVIDQRIMGNGAEAVEHGRVDRFRLTGASEGSPIPRVVGRVRVGGQVIWATKFKEHRSVSGGGGKGAPKPPQTTSFTYSVSLAMALCEGEIARVGRIWADGSEIARQSLQMRVHKGAEDQLPDALIEAVEGADAAPSFRGTAYVVIEDLDLTPFGNRLPQLSFEVVRSVHVPGLIPGPSELVRGVALVPGTGEYALATTPVYYDHGDGLKDSANVNTVQDSADLEVSLENLVEEMPNVRAASLVVSWFGDDLRCNVCTLRPYVEQQEADGSPIAWSVSGLSRTTAGTVPKVDGRPVYGGTPDDTSVIEAIRAITARGLDVTFYPFILMTQLEGNNLPDPWGGEEQSVLPWRGRVTTSVAPGLPSTPDQTDLATSEVAAFFGTASASDFDVLNGEVIYSGPDEWTYRRFILHYAALCAAAGGVEAFCIGSEMHALTQIRGADNRFPAVEQLIALVGQVRALLPGAKLGYAADWSEYFGYQPGDTGNVHFHLDPLWAAPEIDFIGIDNYMPLSDWRDGTGHEDISFGNILNLDYLQKNIEGGEGFDWYYPTTEARNAQRRVPITDAGQDEPWIFRYKDIRSWWSKSHHERIDGQRSDVPTDWVPRSKPVRLTEYGCAAINKGSNQPNKFLDPKSSESGLPYYSNGRRDDAMQMQYLRAVASHWNDPQKNAESDKYDGRMVDLDHSFAWAWDTRPWPSFPGLLDFWSDARNFDRGHWICGRSAGQPLAGVIAEICVESGLIAFDVSRVYGVVRGYAVQDIQNARADIQPLLIAYGIDVAERKGVLTFFMRSDAAEWEIAEQQLVREDGPVLEVQRSSDAEIPGRVRVHHIDAGGSFAARTGDAVGSGRKQLPVAETELPLALTAGEGHGLAERFLAEARISRESFQAAVPPSNRQILVGDHVRFKGGSDIWRLDRIEDGGRRQFQAVRVEKSVLEASDIAERASGAIRPNVALPVDVVFMDLPSLTGEDVPAAPHIAVSARPWPGSVAVYSSVEDAGYRLNTLLDVPSAIGRTENVLKSASPALWDHGPELFVNLQSGALSSATEFSVLSGANAIAIGEGSIAGWEIFQFRDARLISPGVWGLSARLRGQRGTEPFIRTEWPVGSTVVLLDGSPKQINFALDAIGLPRHYRIGTARLAVDHQSFVYKVETANAESLRPYRPAHLRAVRDSNGLVMTWIRRSRAVLEAWEAPDIGLAEAFERYRVVVHNDLGDIVYEVDVTSPLFVLSSEQLLSVNPSAGPLDIRVAQVSDSFGPGHWASVSVA